MTLVITTVLVTKDFVVKSNLLSKGSLIWTHLKHELWILLKFIFLINHTFCVFVRIASSNNMGMSMKKKQTKNPLIFLSRPN